MGVVLPVVGLPNRRDYLQMGVILPVVGLPKRQDYPPMGVVLPVGAPLSGSIIVIVVFDVTLFGVIIGTIPNKKNAFWDPFCTYISRHYQGKIKAI